VDVLGATEAAALVGVSRQRLSQLIDTYDDFPRGQQLARGRVWPRRDLEEWLARHPERRPGRPRTIKQEA
jgi:predicted DNA-binding transcriptional regulator AlpA